MILSSSETYMAAVRLRNSVFSIAEQVPRKQMQLPLAQSEKRTLPAKRLYTMLIRGVKSLTVFTGVGRQHIVIVAIVERIVTGRLA